MTQANQPDQRSKEAWPVTTGEAARRKRTYAPPSPTVRSSANVRRMILRAPPKSSRRLSSFPAARGHPRPDH